MDYTVLDWLEKTAGLYGEKAAFIDEARSLSFSGLLDTARRIGGALLDYCSPGQPVIVMTGRHVYTPACFFGVVYSGCFYAPVDGQMPLPRLQSILSVVRAKVLITDAENRKTAESLHFPGTILQMEELMASEAPPAERLMRVRLAMSPDMPLYVIFTSGSTGAPKGVVTSHLSLMGYIDAVCGVLRIDEEDISGSQSPLDYIAAIRDLYFPVYRGSTTVILPKKLFVLPPLLMEALERYQVTTICWSTSALSLAARMGAFSAPPPRSLRKICFSGSVMPGKVLRAWQEYLPWALFVNQYGPTETTASCTYHVVREKAEDTTVLPIGRPYRQYRIVLLNDDLSETPAGQTGEICVLGPMLALGYYNAPEKTERAFIRNPLNTAYPERMYRTGDYGSFTEDGTLLYHGRRDRQIKHLGHRVELDEVEAASLAVSGVEEACVEYDTETECIELFYTGEAQMKQIASAMRERLPGFMAPRRILRLEEMPRLPNGKVDRAAVIRNGRKK